LYVDSVKYTKYENAFLARDFSMYTRNLKHYNKSISINQNDYFSA